METLSLSYSTHMSQHICMSHLVKCDSVALALPPSGVLFLPKPVWRPGCVHSHSALYSIMNMNVKWGSG